MIVWLVDFDGKIENFALMRLSAWHKAQGDTVVLKKGKAYPELFGLPDKVYISCIFRWNKRAALHLAESWGDRAEIGGPGVAIQSALPPSVSAMAPDYDLYGDSRAVGFISRGCPNKCPWCIVPEKEGNIRRVATALSVTGPRTKKALILDNNFLALPGHQNDLAFLAYHGIKIDFNQGLDAGLITASNARLLAKCAWDLPGGEKVRLALDSVGKKKHLSRAVHHLESAGIKRHDVFVYVLIGFSGFESDVTRLLSARSLGVRVFPMGYRDINTGSEPMRGWNKVLYKKWKRLFIRMPFARKMWIDFKQEVGF